MQCDSLLCWAGLHSSKRRTKQTTITETWGEGRKNLSMCSKPSLMTFRVNPKWPQFHFLETNRSTSCDSPWSIQLHRWNFWRHVSHTPRVRWQIQRHRNRTASPAHCGSTAPGSCCQQHGTKGTTGSHGGQEQVMQERGFCRKGFLWEHCYNIKRFSGRRRIVCVTCLIQFHCWSTLQSVLTTFLNQWVTPNTPVSGLKVFRAYFGRAGGWGVWWKGEVRPWILWEPAIAVYPCTCCPKSTGMTCGRNITGSFSGTPGDNGEKWRYQGKAQWKIAECIASKRKKKYKGKKSTAAQGAAEEMG